MLGVPPACMGDLHRWRLAATVSLVGCLGMVALVATNTVPIAPWSYVEPFRALRVAVTFDWMSIPQLSHFDQTNETCSAFYRSDVCSAILVSNIHTIAKPPPVKPAREAPKRYADT